ncbi:hypothetical protein NBZ79_11260 [Sneathiella marina]|uniref:Uncharacterized protein n=1 Tax=Sneathiella marina TaxID=2950108 RepID=A0ABY4W1Z3_9PROT|nr:hypothetical protein [Sneathiella marina]USG59755.1 hypothetical protein NBZ79_11260 [Sneathiella marina]
MTGDINFTDTTDASSSAEAGFPFLIKAGFPLLTKVEAGLEVGIEVEAEAGLEVEAGVEAGVEVSAAKAEVASPRPMAAYAHSSGNDFKDFNSGKDFIPMVFLETLINISPAPDTLSRKIHSYMFPPSRSRAL